MECMCYFCKEKGSAQDILSHTLESHTEHNTFSLRVKRFCDKSGDFVYVSIHFKDTIHELIVRKQDGFNIDVNITDRIIYFKKKPKTTPKSKTQYTQTTNHAIYN